MSQRAAEWNCSGGCRFHTNRNYEGYILSRNCRLAFANVCVYRMVNCIIREEFLILTYSIIFELLCPHKLWVPPWSRRPKEDDREEPPESRDPDDKVPPSKGKAERRKPSKDKRPRLICDGLVGWGHHKPDSVNWSLLLGANVRSFVSSLESEPSPK